jgi:metal-dependent hydrolase (beta-lactamase superfamily II)
MNNNKTIDASWAKMSTSFLVGGKKIAILFDAVYDADTIYKLLKEIKNEIDKLLTK